jgi:formylglycine-generating enzyme required for sulfatase activity
MRVASSGHRDRFLLAVLAVLLAPLAAHAAIDWVPIGDTGNPGDSQPQGSFGSVDYAYSISKFETTNAEYADFLNAKAASDPLGLWNPSMESDTHGGITRTGSSGSYVYTPKAGFENEAVNFVSFFDAMRYANWLHNGEGNGDTETGSYTLLGGTATPSNGSTVERNPDATVVLPNQDEWFKAAYYDGTGGLYYDYPTGTDVAPTCTSPKPDPNTANCGNSTIRGVTPVGAYTGSPSAYGTYDQGGNVGEWLEDVVFGGGRAVRGGNWTNVGTSGLRASAVGSWQPITANNYLGFRLALVDAGGPGGDSLDVTKITLSKRVVRFDGVLDLDPYVFEACVSGTGILGADVSRLGGSPVVLQQEPFGDDADFCFRTSYPDANSMELNFPDGFYDFMFFGSDRIDSKSLLLGAAEPGGYVDVLTPSDGAFVPDDQDLQYAWTLVEKGNGAGCVAAETCADEIAVRIDEFSMLSFGNIVDDRLPITASGTVVSAADLQPEAEYEARIGTSTGTVNPGDTTDGGDPTETVATYEDTNIILVLVPEPGALLQAVAALMTVGVLVRHRAGRD